MSIVKQIISANGEGILGDPARFKALFSDLAKDEPKPLRLAFGRGLEAGAYLALKTAPDAAERASRKTAIARRLRDDQRLDINHCAEAMDILEAALFGTVSTAGQGRSAQQAPPVRPQPRHQQPHSYHRQMSSPPEAPVRTAPAQAPQSVSFQASGGNTPPAPAARNNAVRYLLIAAASLAVIVITVVIARRGPPHDTELQNTALEIAAILNSASFEGFDPGERIIHYYFIPVTSAEALGVAVVMLFAGEINYITVRDMDSGVEKARSEGYETDYGVVLFRENNRRDGKIIITPAGVEETY